MAYFNSNSEEVKNAKLIYKPQEVFIKNVTRGNSGQKYYKGWWADMYEIETDVGVYISAEGRPYDQKNIGSGPVVWSDFIGQYVNVVTVPSDRAPEVKFLWIKKVANKSNTSISASTIVKEQSVITNPTVNEGNTTFPQKKLSEPNIELLSALGLDGPGLARRSRAQEDTKTNLYVKLDKKVDKNLNGIMVVLGLILALIFIVGALAS
jgi:hypothetical protein